jgi:hypothetical protein
VAFQSNIDTGSVLGGQVTLTYTFTSSTVDGHSHQVTIPPSDMEQDFGWVTKTYVTTDAGTPSHSHVLTVNADDWHTLSEGQVTVTTNAKSGYAAHTFVLKL